MSIARFSRISCLVKLFPRELGDFIAKWLRVNHNVTCISFSLAPRLSWLPNEIEAKLVRSSFVHFLRFRNFHSNFKIAWDRLRFWFSLRTTNLMSHNELAIAFRLIVPGWTNLSTNIRREWLKQQDIETEMVQPNGSQCVQQFKQTIFHPHNTRIISFRLSLSLSPDESYNW